MKDHPTIVLKSQVVRVKLYRQHAEVDCTFVLHSTGQATSVQIGFPELRGGPEGLFPEKGFEAFRSYVDGKPVKVRVYDASANDEVYQRWYVKQVRFQTGQTRVIRNTYRVALGITSTGQRLFSYTLHTGASWKEPIGRADIIVELMGVEKAKLWDILPGGYRRERNKIVRRFENFEPEAEHDLYIAFLDGYSVEVNGIYRQVVPVDEVVRQGGTLLVSARWLGEMLGAEIAWDASSRSVVLTHPRTNRSITLPIGTARAIVNGQNVRLPAAAILVPEEGRWSAKVPLRAVVQALGGYVEYHPSEMAFSITLASAPKD